MQEIRAMERQVVKQIKQIKQISKEIGDIGRVYNKCCN